MGTRRTGLMAIVVTLALSSCMTVIPAIAPGARDIEPDISAAFPYTHQRVSVLDSEMAYVDVGQGQTFLLVHGNPTSSYLWRNVIPILEEAGRVIAVDMIGFGESGKPDLGYQLEDHLAYFDAFVDALDLDDVILVLHDWGGALGVNYAVNNPDRVRGIATFESVIRPQEWSEAPFVARYIFRRLRDPERGQQLIAQENYFIEQLMPMMTGRDFTEEEMAAYNEPFPTAESRQPIAQWPREIPLSGEPARTHAIVERNYRALAESDIPLLLLYAQPGMIVTEETLETFRSDIPRVQTEFIGSGYHYLQEVQPTRIGQAIRDWSNTL